MNWMHKIFSISILTFLSLSIEAEQCWQVSGCDNLIGWVRIDKYSYEAAGKSTYKISSNGDGVKLTNYIDAPVLFDIDHDSGATKEQTGWVSAQDGIVVYDRNSNDKIDDISETLSEYFNGAVGTNGSGGTKPYANGLAALKSLDSNSDNQFTSADTAWENVKVWVDVNHDGITDAGELKTLSSLNITSINLNQTAQSGLVRDGNEILASSTFIQNGQTKEALAANFIANA